MTRRKLFATAIAAPLAAFALPLVNQLKQHHDAVVREQIIERMQRMAVDIFGIHGESVNLQKFIHPRDGEYWGISMYIPNRRFDEIDRRTERLGERVGFSRCDKASAMEAWCWDSERESARAALR
jgi:hypothetical protein